MLTYGLISAAVIVAATYLVFLKRAQKLVRQALTFRDDLTIPENSQTKETYVFLGDSLFAGVGVKRQELSLPYRIAQLRAKHPVRVVNAARCGSKIRDLYEQINKVRFVLDDRATVFIFMGSNDVLRFSKSEDFGRVFGACLRRLLEFTDKVVVITIPDFTFCPALQVLGWAINLKAKQLNWHVRGEATQTQVVQLVDLYQVKLDSPEYYASDQFHPSERGYELWAQYIAKHSCSS